ncbi:hypothetical protein WA158_006520 [Blastocystis sp. Blastoise]
MNMNMDFDPSMEKQVKETTDALEKISLRIVGFKTEGLKRTKRSILSKYVTKDLADLQSFPELYEKAYELREKYMALDVFDDVQIELDTPPNNFYHKDSDVIMIMNFKEKNIFSLGLQGQLSSILDETSIQADLNLCNLMGYAENISTNIRYDVFTKSNTFGITGHFPAFPWVLDANVYKTSNNYVKQSSVYESLTGIKLVATPPSLPAFLEQLDTHFSVFFEYVYRDLFPFRTAGMPKYEYKASQTMLNQCRPSVKSSVGFNFNIGDMDDPVNPTIGYMFNNSLEVAGLGGDAHFVKNQSSLDIHVPLSSSYWSSCLAGHLNFSLGYLKSFGNPSLFYDRFFAENHRIRGIMTEEIGPKANPKEGGRKTGDTLGGDILCMSSVSISSPLSSQSLQAIGAQAHAFFNVGSIFNQMDSHDAIRNSFLYTYGFGIYIPLGGIGKIELNYLINKRKINLMFKI